MIPSYNQSIENYDYYYYDIKQILDKDNIIKCTTEIMILDEFILKNLINEDFYNDNKSDCIKKDKKDKYRDFYYSLLCSSTLLTLLFCFNLYKEQNKILKYIYISYLLIVYLLTYMFYRKLV